MIHVLKVVDITFLGLFILVCKIHVGGIFADIHFSLGYECLTVKKLKCNDCKSHLWDLLQCIKVS